MPCPTFPLSPLSSCVRQKLVKCVKRLSPVGDSRCQKIYEDPEDSKHCIHLPPTTALNMTLAGPMTRCRSAQSLCLSSNSALSNQKRRESRAERCDMGVSGSGLRYKIGDGGAREDCGGSVTHGADELLSAACRLYVGILLESPRGKSFS